MRRYLAMGFRLVLAGSDLSFLLSAAKERAARRPRDERRGGGARPSWAPARAPVIFHCR